MYIWYTYVLLYAIFLYSLVVLIVVEIREEETANVNEGEYEEVG